MPPRGVWSLAPKRHVMSAQNTFWGPVHCTSLRSYGLVLSKWAGESMCPHSMSNESTVRLSAHRSWNASLYLLKEQCPCGCPRPPLRNLRLRSTFPPIHDAPLRGNTKDL